MLSFLMGIECELYASVILFFILNKIPGIGQDYSDKISSFFSDGMMSLLILLVLSPVLEELIFRYLILYIAQSFLPFFAANIIQAILFGIYHMNIVQGIYAFIFGILVGVIYKYTASIVPCICFHAAFNDTAFILEKFIPRDIGAGVRLLIMVISLAAFVYTFILLRKSGCDRQTA